MRAITLQGVIATVVTPFDANDALDEDALRSELRYLLAANVHGICVCGSTGEGNTLSVDESARVVAIAAEEIDGRVPLVAGVIQDSTSQVVRYGAAAIEAGAQALQVTPIHYLSTPSPEETVAYYRDIGATLDIPLVIYNVIPWAMLGVDVVDALADLPHVVSIKQSGGDLHRVADLIMRVADRVTILSAVDDLLFPSFILGAHGTLAAIQTIAPRLVVGLWDACQAGDIAEARRLHELILPIWRAVEGPNMPSRIKEALRLQGRNGGVARRPLGPVRAAERAAIAAALERASLLAGATAPAN